LEEYKNSSVFPLTQLIEICFFIIIHRLEEFLSAVQLIIGNVT